MKTDRQTKRMRSSLVCTPWVVLSLTLATTVHAARKSCEERLAQSVQSTLTVLKKSLEARAISLHDLARFVNGAASPFGASQSLTAPMHERAFNTLDATLKPKEREHVREGIRQMLKEQGMEFEVAAQAKDATAEILNPEPVFVSQLEEPQSARGMKQIVYENRSAFVSNRTDDKGKTFLALFDPFNPDKTKRERVLNAQEAFAITEESQLEAGEAGEFFPDTKYNLVVREPFRLNGLKIYGAEYPDGFRFAAKGKKLATISAPTKRFTVYVSRPLAFVHDGKLFGVASYGAKAEQKVRIQPLEGDGPAIESDIYFNTSEMVAVEIKGVPHIYFTKKNPNDKLDLINALTGEAGEIALGGWRENAVAFSYRGETYLVYVTDKSLKVYDFGSGHTVEVSGDFEPVARVFVVEFDGQPYAIFDFKREMPMTMYRLFSAPGKP